MAETSNVFHFCDGMKNLTDPPPYFYVHEQALDLKTNEVFRAVMLAVAGQFSYVACQVDFCPWCGIQLTPYTRARSYNIANEREQYMHYRKQHIKSGQQEFPLSKDEYKAMLQEYNETLMLVVHAKPEHAESLQRRVKVLRDRLAFDMDVTEGDSHVDNPGNGESQPDGSGT